MILEGLAVVLGGWNSIVDVELDHSRPWSCFLNINCVFCHYRSGYLGLFVVMTNIRQITENVGVFLQVV